MGASDCSLFFCNIDKNRGSTSEQPLFGSEQNVIPELID